MLPAYHSCFSLHVLKHFPFLKDITFFVFVFGKHSCRNLYNKLSDIVIIQESSISCIQKGAPASSSWSFISLFFHWNSLHAKLKSHCKSWSYKKKKYKKIRAYRKSVQKKPIVKRCLLILDLKLFRSQIKCVEI